MCVFILSKSIIILINFTFEKPLILYQKLKVDEEFLSARNNMVEIDYARKEDLNRNYEVTVNLMNKGTFENPKLNLTALDSFKVSKGSNSKKIHANFGLNIFW